MKKLLLTFLLFSLAWVTMAQKACWVFFTDKNDARFDPYGYFDAKAIARRELHGLPLRDSTDFPVSPRYIQAVANHADSTGFASRWFNVLEVFASRSGKQQIAALPFVKAVRPMQLQTRLASANYASLLTDDDNELLEKQIAIMQGNAFIQDGIDGSGVRVAIFDGGFPRVDKAPVFSHIREQGRIVKTYDFAHNDEDVYGHNSHGTNVLSCIGGISEGRHIGLATGAGFLLAITEVNWEPFSEEKNWLAAAEWADKHGADIINSSLGYTGHRYYPEEMDGRHSLVARAATMAAKKGILVVNSMGNSGDDEYWKIVGTPADADSVLSVAAVDPMTGYHISFSSLGPTADMRLKPNVTAAGSVIAAHPRRLHHTYGTSFSAPLVAGFAACVLQLNPQLTNMELKSTIEQSGHLYPYFDYAHGYGIPQAVFFTNEDPGIADVTFQLKHQTGEVDIIALPGTFSKEKGDFLYYNIQLPDGTLGQYSLIEVDQQEVASIPLLPVPTGGKINVHFKGYTYSYFVNKKE